MILIRWEARRLWWGVVKLLLDAHLLLWTVGHPNRMSPTATALITAPEYELFFSTASLSETAIKRGLARSDFKVDARISRCGLLDNAYSELPIGGEHAVAIDSLPAIHNDPFDRIILARAAVEGITLLTVDSIVAQYPGPVKQV